MSEVISFRLDKGNLREAKALLVLQDHTAKGFNLRQTITEALLKLDQYGEVESGSDLFDDLNETQCQVNHLLRIIEDGKSLCVHNHAVNNNHNGLTASFVDSVKKSVKSGLKLD